MTHPDPLYPIQPTASLRLYTDDQADAALLQQLREGLTQADAFRALREAAESAYGNRCQPSCPSKHAPGTLGKLRDMRERASRKPRPEGLFHPLDASMESRAVVNPVTILNGSDPLRVLQAVDERDLVESDEELTAEREAALFAEYDAVMRRDLAAYSAKRAAAAAEGDPGKAA